MDRGGAPVLTGDDIFIVGTAGHKESLLEYEKEFPAVAGLNKVMIIGNLGKDPEMRFTANGSAVTNFRVAVSRSYAAADGERREETEWFNVVAWTKLAELCNQFLQKGRKVYVEGRLQTRSWDGQDGQKRFQTDVVATEVQFLDRGPGGPGGGDREPVDNDITDPDDLPFE